MKLFRIMTILCILLITLTIPSHAVEHVTKVASDDFSWSGIATKANTFIDEGDKNKKEIDASNLVNGLATILTTIGAVIVLVGLLVMGIKYMVATPEEAAKLKTKIVGLVLAGVVILGAFGIWNLAYRFFDRNDSLKIC